MDPDTIENHIKNLGKRDFDAIVRLILTHVYNLKTIDVDGPGDGGADMLPFADEFSKRIWASISIQKTVQQASWKAKALADAKKSKEQLGSERYFFLTSRAHQSTTLREVESQISATYGMPAVCLGAKELAGMIAERELYREFAEALGLQLNVVVNDRPDKAEVLLHAYVALGSDRSDLRNEVYDDSLLIALHEADSSMSRDRVARSAAELLGGGLGVQERLSRRIDSLLSHKRIEPAGVGMVALSAATKMELKAADGIYIKELTTLASAQSQVLKDVCNLEWDNTQCESAATLLSRWFIQRQLATAEHASLNLAKTGLARTLGDPQSELRELLSHAGVPPKSLNKVLDEFVSLASDTPLIKKLTKAVTYVATEGQDPLKASRVLGASNWSEVTTTLDASVAIPYLCASLFAPTQGRFSYGANECVHLLKKQGAHLVIPWVYVNEVSAHLLRALNYPETRDFDDSLGHSQNGFVAHYYQMKAAGMAVPPSLREFIEVFSKAAVQKRPSASESVRAIMSDVQPLFAEYGIQFDDISRVPQHFRKEVETAYMFKLETMKRSKAPLLIEHDVQVLANARRAKSESAEIRMCLTWDAIMIGVGKELEDCGWIVSPHEAADIVQVRLKISGAKLTALAHSLARVRERPSEMGARIVDRVVQLAAEQMQEWQFRNRLKIFYDEALDRIDLESESYREVDNEIEQFLRSEGIATAISDLDAGE